MVSLHNRKTVTKTALSDSNKYKNDVKPMGMCVYITCKVVQCYRREKNFYRFWHPRWCLEPIPARFFPSCNSRTFSSFLPILIALVGLFVCMWRSTCHGKHMEVKGQFVWVVSVPPCESQGLNSAPQTWSPVPVPAEASRQYTRLLLHGDNLQCGHWGSKYVMISL